VCHTLVVISFSGILPCLIEYKKKHLKILIGRMTHYIWCIVFFTLFTIGILLLLITSNVHQWKLFLAQYFGTYNVDKIWALYFIVVKLILEFSSKIPTKWCFSFLVITHISWPWCKTQLSRLRSDRSSDCSYFPKLTFLCTHEIKISLMIPFYELPVKITSYTNPHHSKNEDIIR
jgi:hypothetical protein